MKRLFISTVFLFLMVVSCVDEYHNRQIPSEDNNIGMRSNEVSVAEAMDILHEIFSGVSPSDTKSDIFEKTISSIDTLSVDDLGVERIVTKAANDFSNLMYIVNFKEDGFALLGADKRLMPVIALVEQGNAQVNDFITNNTHSQLFTLDQLYCEEDGDYYVGNTGDFSPASFIRAYLENSIQAADDDTIYRYYSVVDEEYGPTLMETAWEQKKPFNLLFTYPGPDGYRPAGCGTIAAAQVFAKTKVPSLSKSFNITNMTWDELEIPTYYNEDYDKDTDMNWEYYISTYPNYELRQENISKVVRIMAEGIGAKYNFLGTDGTFMTPQQLCRYMKKVGYKTAVKHNGYSRETIKNSLKQEHPVIMSALADNWSGHFWVVDAYAVAGRINSLTGEKDEVALFHCNWGWRGSWDGFYAGDLFNPYDPWTPEKFKSGKEFTGISHHCRIITY